MIQVLIAHGANVNAQLKTQQPYRAKLDRGDDTMLTTGTTPLLRAAKAGDVEVMRLLLAKGADPKLDHASRDQSADGCGGIGNQRRRHYGRHKTEAMRSKPSSCC